MYGSIGKLGLLTIPATTNQAICAFQPSDHLDAEYLFWWLRYKRRDLYAMGRGGTQKNIGQGDLRRLSIPLPPLEEQQRLVGELRRLVSNVESGAARLERASGDVGRFVAAVDHATFGRRQQGWNSARLDELTLKITSGSRDWKRYYGRGDGTFVLTQNVRMRRLDLNDRLPVDPPPSDPACARSEIAENDLLLTIVGANVGNVARVDRELAKHYVCQSLALIRPNDATLSRLLELYLASPVGGQRYFRDECFYGQGRPHIKFDDLKRMPIPVPPDGQRQALVDRLSSVLDSSRVTFADLNGATARADALCQAILHAAFTGELSTRGSGEPMDALGGALA